MVPYEMCGQFCGYRKYEGSNRMKIIINENERGFLFKDGSFVRMLESGKHTVWAFLGQSIQTCKAEGAVTLNDVDNKLLLRDRAFEDATVCVHVPDGHFAIRYEDGRVAETLSTGEYYFWNILHKQSFQLVDITKPEITELDAKALASVPVKHYIRVEVPSGYCALLYFDGSFQRTIENGTYFFWNGSVKVDCQLVDMRIQQLDIVGQEILTADKVSLRINFVCSYKITDALHIMSDIKDYKAQIHVMTQLILREYVGKYRFDELLEQKENIAGFVLAKLKEKQSSLHVAFIDSGLKDIILPGEIRDIMNTVLVAEKKAQANVITRREEVASTRSLLNTAKLLDENATLYKLKELEYLEKICDKVGNISVGNGNLLGQLGELITTTTYGKQSC